MTERAIPCPDSEVAAGSLHFPADLLDGAPEAIFLLDADLSIRWANPRAQALAGAPLPALLAQPIEELLETDALASSPLHEALEEDRGVHGLSARFKVGGGGSGAPSA